MPKCIQIHTYIQTYTLSHVHTFQSSGPCFCSLLARSLRGHLFVWYARLAWNIKVWMVSCLFLVVSLCPLLSLSVPSSVSLSCSRPLGLSLSHCLCLSLSLSDCRSLYLFLSFTLFLSQEWLWVHCWFLLVGKKTMTMGNRRKALVVSSLSLALTLTRSLSLSLSLCVSRSLFICFSLSLSFFLRCGFVFLIDFYSYARTR